MSREYNMGDQMTGGNDLARIETGIFYNEAVTVWSNMMYYLSVGYFGVVFLLLAFFSAAVFYGYMTNANKVEQMRKRMKRSPDLVFGNQGIYTARDVAEAIQDRNNWNWRIRNTSGWQI